MRSRSSSLSTTSSPADIRDMKRKSNEKASSDSPEEKQSKGRLVEEEVPASEQSGEGAPKGHSEELDALELERSERAAQDSAVGEDTIYDNDETEVEEANDNGLRSPTDSEIANRPWLVNFYDERVNAKDPQGRTLQDILYYNEDEIEDRHDFIQHMFPLPEPSRVQGRAELITPEVQAAFLADIRLRRRLVESLDRMLDFYGFEMNANGDVDLVATCQREEAQWWHQPLISPREGFDLDAPNTWRMRSSHNHLRLTRIIRSLRVLGLEVPAQHLHRALLVNDPAKEVCESTRMYWARAAQRPLHLPPSEDNNTAQGIPWLRWPQPQQAPIVEGNVVAEEG
ncbi:hypothetical protein LTR37_005235 [Vermiconidia calcicola]|uniref:Uncharacterized protein n=1 Tax=Vermiconidia calcicola TaxID=1690605 RepID=A0ACC3NK53_9PEZI|nr:hypothetical protein LTR37_005235 [Vermiconidia calcicola]